MKKIAIVAAGNGNALSCLEKNLVVESAKRLSRIYLVDILSIENALAGEGTDLGSGVRVKKFPLSCDKEGKKLVNLPLTQMQQLINGLPTEIEEDMAWLQQRGPDSAELEDYVMERRGEYHAFLFLNCMSCITVKCLPNVAEKSVLIPLATDKMWLGQSVFQELFHLPQCLVYLNEAEKSFIQATYYNAYIPNVVIVDPSWTTKGKGEEVESICVAVDFVTRGKMKTMLSKESATQTTGRDLFSDALPSVEIIRANRSTAIKPVFGESEVCAVFVSSEAFAKYLGVLIYSVIVNCAPSRNYHLVILTTDMAKKSMCQIAALAKDLQNVKIQFVNVDAVVNMKEFQTKGTNYSGQTYLRLLLPELMRHHKKVLYLDADVLANADIAQLYDEDVTGFHMAGTYDILITAWQSNPQNEMYRYFQSQGLTERGKYMQAGVVLFHLEEMRKDFKPGFLLKRARIEKHILVDQDLLNIYSKGRIKIVGLKWNVLALGAQAAEIIHEWLPDQFYQEYIEARKSPKIVHYADKERPGVTPDFDMSELYWSYARRTPFYESLLMGGAG